MTESHLWKKLKEALPEADLARHEDRSARGVPDVSYGLRGVNGWIELKSFEKWPKCIEDELQFNNFKRWQRTWIRRRGRKGGHCFVLIIIEEPREYLLFSHLRVMDLGHLNRPQLYQASLMNWRSEMDSKRLSELLSSS